MLLTWLLIALSSSLACDGPATTVGQVDRALAKWESAAGTPRAARRWEHAVAITSCVEEVLSRPLALRAARLGRPIEGGGTGAWKVPVEARSRWTIDGSPTHLWDAARGHVVQELSESGQVLRTTLVGPGGAFPAELSWACPEPTQWAQVQEASDALAAAWRGDDERVPEHARAVEEGLRCLRDLAAPHLLAEAWRSLALGSFVGGRLAAAEPWLRASRALTPSARFHTDLLPPMHPMQVGLAGASPRDQVSKLPLPAAGELAVDGRWGPFAPTERPYLLQHADLNGRLASQVVVPGTPLQLYRWQALDAEMPSRPRRMLQGRPALVALTAASVALAASGGATWASGNALYGTHCPEDDCPGTASSPSQYYDRVIQPRQQAGVSLVAVGATGAVTSLVWWALLGR